MLIEALKALLIGLVEGITEWLPISSTGHMILVDEFVKLQVSDSFLALFLVVIQIGAIMAVIILYFHKLNPFSPSKTVDERRSTWRLWGMVVIGCLPAAVFGFALDDFMNEHFYNKVTVAAMLILYGIVFIVLERRNRRRFKEALAEVETPRGRHARVSEADAEAAAVASLFKVTNVDDIDWKTALKIGFFQCLAMVPGTSRSGATIIGGSGLMGRAGVAYSSGFKAIMTAVPYLLGMLIFSGFAGRISAVGTSFNITSIPDLFERRFGKATKVTLGALIAFTMMGTVAAQVTATATIINMLGGEIGVSYEMGAFIACAVFIIYTATSGLFGVIYTDVFQFVMLILFVYILIPGASLVKLGGPAAFFRNLAPELATPYVDGTIIGDIITYFVFTLAGAEMWQRAFAAKSQKAAKNGLFLGTVAYGLTIPLVWFMGVVAHQLIGAEKIAMYGTTDAVVPALAIEILPVGLTGLALAGILSVIMSTADSYLIVSVQSCVHDVYKTFDPDMSEKKELILTRVFAVIMPLGALAIALYMKNAYQILMFAWSFYAAAAGLPAFAALYWKKATTAGILSGMIAGFTVCIGWKLAGLPFGLGATVPGAIACAAALVIVSHATYKKSPSPFLDPYAAKT